jgi:hypothetical protein
MNKHFSEWPKSWIQRYVSDILRRKQSGEYLKDMDLEIVVWLIHRHPKAKDKIGAGINGVKIGQTPGWKGKYMEIIRVDGSTIDFSYRKALAGKEPSHYQLFCIGCRSAIAQDIVKFKKETLDKNPVCRHRKVLLKQDNSHVDHVKPKTFKYLVDKYISERDINVDNIEVVGEIRKYFKDKELEKDFRAYHQREAVLELVSAEANQKECKI